MCTQDVHGVHMMYLLRGLQIARQKTNPDPWNTSLIIYATLNLCICYWYAHCIAAGLFSETQLNFRLSGVSHDGFIVHRDLKISNDRSKLFIMQDNVGHGQVFD